MCAADRKPIFHTLYWKSNPSDTIGSIRIVILHYGQPKISGWFMTRLNNHLSLLGAEYWEKKLNYKESRKTC